MKRETPYIRIIGDIEVIIPVREAVIKRRQKGDEGYTCNDAAIKKDVADVLPRWQMFVGISNPTHNLSSCRNRICFIYNKYGNNIIENFKGHLPMR